MISRGLRASPLACRGRRRDRGGPIPGVLHAPAGEAHRAGGAPELIFDRRCALTLLDRVLGRLRREWIEAGKGAAFDRLKVCLTGDAPRAAMASSGANWV
jgi:hypothetical protein